MNALSVGFPGLLKSSFTPFKEAHRSKLLEMNSGPLSTRIVCGLPRCEATPSKTRTKIVSSQSLTDVDGQALTTMVIHSRQQPESLPADQLIGHEVHAPAVIGTLSERTSFANLNALPPTWLSPPNSQAFFAVQPVHELLVHEPPFPSTSCSIFLLSLRSATSCLSFRFSSSMIRSRRSSAMPSPANRFFHR